MMMKEQNSFLLNLAAGGISGIGAKTASAPIERIKLLIQTQAVNRNIVDKTYTNPFTSMLRIYREQGILSFWRGNLANVYRFFPSQALNFALKDSYKLFFVGNAQIDKNSFQVVVGNLVASGIAGATALMVTYPFDLARTRLAVDVGGSVSMKQRVYLGTADCLAKTFKQEGIRGVYSGFVIALGGTFVFRSLFMGGYDSTKYLLDIEHKDILWRAFAAQVVTTVVGTVCYPLDTIKRRLMVQAVGAIEGESTQVVLYKSGWDCFVRVLREEGVRAFFAGLSANLIRGLSGPILLVGYDEMKRLLHGHI